MNKNFASKLLFQFGVEWDYLSKNVWNISLFRVYSKNINFRTESAKKPTIYGFLFVIAICHESLRY